MQITGAENNASYIQRIPERSLRTDLIIQIENCKPDLENGEKSNEV